MEAKASHSAKMDRFHTGPQRSIFRKGPDGLPLVEGGEVAGKFWGSGPGAAENVASFRKLIDENPAMLGQFKRMLTTQGAGTADAAGNLTSKFSKWVNQNLPGLREAFKPDELKTLQNIAADIDRNAASMKAGTSLGGSNTYQNASNALDLGLLDSPMVTRAANMVPVLKNFMGPALESIRINGRNAKAGTLAGLLADTYRIVGKVLHYRIDLSLTSKGSSVGNAEISLPNSLPGKYDISANSGSGEFLLYSGMATMSSPTARPVTPTSLRLQSQGAAAVANLTDANFTNTSSFTVSGTLLLS